MTKGKIFKIIQFFIAAVAFVYVFGLIDYAKSTQIISNAQPFLLASGFLVSLFGLLSASKRWAILLGVQGVHYSHLSAFRNYLTSTFYGIAMPGAIGGDIARVLLCRKATGASFGLLGTSVLVERGFGVIMVLNMLSIGLISTPGIKASFTFYSAICLSVVSTFVVFVLPWAMRNGLFDRIAMSAPIRELFFHKAVQKLKGLSWPVRIRCNDLAAVLLLTLVFQMTDVVTTFLVSRAFGLGIHLPVLLTTLPLVYLASVLPISPAGLGVKEATFAVVLGQFGVSSSDSALLALAIFLNRTAIGVIGAVDQLFGTNPMLTMLDINKRAKAMEKGNE